MTYDSQVAPAPASSAAAPSAAAGPVAAGPAAAQSAAPARGAAAGILLALVSAASFGTSGALARGLLDAGWTAGAAVTARITSAALVLLVPALVALRGRWWLLRRNAGLLTAYGLVAVAGCQLCYFNAVDHMAVGPALLIEYTAPVLVVLWLWARHGQRPGRRTVGGAALAAIGLVGVLDLLGGTRVGPVGVAWALTAMVGAAIYFVLSAADDTGLPPIVLAAGGLVVGAVTLVVAGAIGIVPMEMSTAPVTYRGTSVPWWLPVALLGLVACALAYCAGIAASRRLGPRLASFVALFEVVAALGFAWALLAELPRPVQLVGGLLILAGVIIVKSGEPRDAAVGSGQTARTAGTEDHTPEGPALAPAGPGQEPPSAPGLGPATGDPAPEGLATAGV
ncbi:EamA family transporter [Frankia sp. CNm7]|nr:EamA family transporter [Frankia nepalensis]MBL7495698.1 EamA family transporter [Frankia nepalensis]MBL7511375.1 EamA family transporter [Frankia nepalensis]MBL7521460.1 EamA family transporter [Frankia nepalensis]